MIKPDLAEHVLHPILPAHLYDEQRLLGDKDFFYCNPTGKFVVGGPMGDTGLTGRKIIVDTYGGAARHGGGAFSGKDPTKVDRSAAYAARYVAKNVVAAGLAEPLRAAGRLRDRRRAPGLAPGGVLRHRADEMSQIEALVREHFDLRPAAIIRDLDLRRPIYAKTAAYGHFGRDDHDFTWERTDKADVLREAAGLVRRRRLPRSPSDGLRRPDEQPASCAARRSTRSSPFSRTTHLPGRGLGRGRPRASCPGTSPWS